jgi:hypothetical protein
VMHYSRFKTNLAHCQWGAASLTVEAFLRLNERDAAHISPPQLRFIRRQEYPHLPHSRS